VNGLAARPGSMNAAVPRGRGTAGKHDVRPVQAGLSALGAGVRNGITRGYGADPRDRLRVREDPHGRGR